MSKDDMEVEIELGMDNLDSAEFDADLNAWLAVVAKTAIAHMKYCDGMSETPEALNEDDFGLLELERAFLVLYAIHTKGGLPISAMSKRTEKH